MVGKVIKFSGVRARIVSLSPDADNDSIGWLMQADLIGNRKFLSSMVGTEIEIEGTNFIVKSVKRKRIVFEKIRNKTDEERQAEKAAILKEKAKK